MANDGKFPWSDIPSNFPDISMMHLTDAQLDDLKHILPVDAIKEGRRRQRERSNARRAEMNEYAANMRDKEVAMNVTATSPPPSSDIASVPATGESSQPTTSASPAATPSTDINSPTDTPDNEHRNVRRRLQDDAATTTDSADTIISAPQFLGKTPVKESRRNTASKKSVDTYVEDLYPSN